MSPQDEQPAAPEDAGIGASGNRARVLFAGVTAVALAVATVIVVLGGSGSGGDEPVAPAPPECTEGWNSDLEAVRFGRHNSESHAYLEVQVTRLAEDGTAPPSPDEGACAVIFARNTLDPEPVAAAQIQRPDGSWTPLAHRPGISTRELERLQSEALELANADLRIDGKIAAPE